MSQTSHDSASPVQPLPRPNASLQPGEELSYLIRTANDAMRLTGLLHQECLSIASPDSDDRNLEYLREAEELAMLAKHWDAPLSDAAWNRIAYLCDDLCGNYIMNGSDAYEEDMYRMFCVAIKIAARRKITTSDTPSTADNGEVPTSQFQPCDTSSDEPGLPRPAAIFDL